MSSNAIDLFLSRVSQSRDKLALRWKENGVWRDATFGDWGIAADEIAAGLLAIGLSPRDRVGLLAQTRPEWMHADIGILRAGAVTVPIYPSNLSDECAYILRDSGARVVFAENDAQVTKLITERHALGQVMKVVTFDGAKHKDWTISLAELRALGRERIAAHPGELETVRGEISPDDMLTIVYTSGTTGPPKGVVLTHANFQWEAEAMRDVIPVGAEDLQLLFLPLAHIFARILEWVTIVRGAPVAFASSIPALKTEMAEVAPTFMCVVPRVLEKLYLGILGNRHAASPTRQKIFDWAFAVGREMSLVRQRGHLPSFSLEARYAIATKLVFAKIHALLGGRMRFIVSGGAPLSKEIAEFFHAAGVLILEGWGLTETAAGTCINRMERYRFGTVGPPVPGIEIRIAPDGEILVRGGSVMREYYGKPDATREVIDADGWFHTGDIGVLEDGILRITDRKKDIIVTAGGKNVSPQNLENALKATPYISQVMVHGDKRPYLTALLTVNAENAVGLSAAEIEKRIQDAVDALNAKEPSYSSIKKFRILPNDFSQETGELTPTLKVKRKFATEKYRNVLDEMYR